MKAVQGFGIGAVITVISAGAWVGCSSSTTTSTVDGGSDAAGDTSTTGETGPGAEASTTDSGGKDSAIVDAADAGDAGDATVHWPAVYSEVIAVHCKGCHEPAITETDGAVIAAHGGFTIGKLDLSTIDAGYLNLVGDGDGSVHAQGTESLVDGSVACDTLADGGDAGSYRVVPGNAAASLLYLKVNGYTTPPPCSLPMPASGFLEGGVQAEVVSEIKSWINEGAQP